MSLTFLQIGLGSMGKRRVRNLFANGEKNVIGFDLSPERRQEAEKKYGIRTIKDIKKVSEIDFDAVIISSPPDTHGKYIRFALERKKHFFAEHPTLLDGYEDILRNKNLKVVKAPSCTFLFYAPVKRIKNILDKGRIGKVLAFNYHMGQYLPDWHPWEDYRKVYFSQKETGACREMFPFELIWLNWLMGSEVAGASGFMGKVSNLDMDAEDILFANLKYKNGVLGNIMIDVISRAPFRTLRILGSEGVLNWERFDHEINLYNAKTKSWKVIKVKPGRPESGYINEEEMYNDEIGAWLDAIYGKAPYPYTFEESQKNLGILYRLKPGE